MINYQNNCFSFEWTTVPSDHNYFCQSQSFAKYFANGRKERFRRARISTAWKHMQSCNAEETDVENMTSWHFRVQFTQQTQRYTFTFGNVIAWDLCCPWCNRGGWKIGFALLKHPVMTWYRDRQRKTCWRGKSKDISAALTCQQIVSSEPLTVRHANAESDC